MGSEKRISTLIKRADARRLVADLYNQGMPIKDITAHVPVSSATVYRWIDLPKRKTVNRERRKSTMVRSSGEALGKSVEPKDESENALLKAQIKELKAQLQVANLKAKAYETMVGLAEERFGIAIRKKSGAKQ